MSERFVKIVIVLQTLVFLAFVVIGLFVSNVWGWVLACIPIELVFNCASFLSVLKPIPQENNGNKKEEI